MLQTEDKWKIMKKSKTVQDQMANLREKILVSKQEPNRMQTRLD